MISSRDSYHSSFEKRGKDSTLVLNDQIICSFSSFLYHHFCFSSRNMLTLPRKYILIMSNQDLTYTTAMKELESIVERLQSPECEIDQLCDLTRRSVELLKFCRAKLTATDEDLTKLLEKID